MVQEDENMQEHIIYYLSRSLVDTELSYAHVEKLALLEVHASQRLWHYIIIRNPLVILDNMNPLQYILTHWMIGGKLSKYIVIL